MHYKVGSRDSKLALIQTDLVCKALVEANPDLSLAQFEVIKIKTLGDKIQHKNLIEIGGKNLFIKEIEEALLEKKIDFAVHSLKDMTAKLDSKLVIAACLEREDPRDAFVSVNYNSLKNLPLGSLIGTSSIRRKSLVLDVRPDLMTISFRGNVLTRLEKLKQKRVDATFLAMAGLKRLEIDKNLYHPIEINEFLPAISQGVIGVECRAEDQNIYQLLRSINHPETENCTQAERGFLECLDANCSVPVAAYATLKDQQINIETLVIDSKGRIYKSKGKDVVGNAYKLGYEMGLELRDFKNL